MSEKITVPVENWGKDHYNTLLYAETRIVDYKGNLNLGYMRTSGANYGTRLRDGSELLGHSELDILAELESEGLLVLTDGSRATLTDLGWSVAGKVRRARAESGAHVLAQVNAMHAALATFA